MTEERKALLLKLAKRDGGRDYNFTFQIHLEKAKEMEVHIEKLEQILFADSNVQ